MIYIKLTPNARKELQALQRGSTYRLGVRCHAILLSDKGYSIPQLVEIFDVDRDTIRSWFQRWEENGISGLSDASRSGRPPVFTPQEEAQILEEAKKEPIQQVKCFQKKMEKRFKKSASLETFKRILKRGGLT